MPKYKRWMAVFDNHGDMFDPGAVAAMFEFKKFWKPEIAIHGGDALDLRCLRKNATEGEKRERIKGDIDAGVDFLKRYKPTQYMRGNHCERLWDAAKGDDGKLADFASQLILDIEEALPSGCVMYPYDKRKGVFRMGHAKFIHGYNAGVTAARIAGQVYGSVMMGHTHCVDAYSLPGLERRVARVCGCLCKLSMDYNRAHLQTLRQAHGWVYGLLMPSGDYVVWQAEMVAGRWFFPSEVREVAHAK